MDLTALKTELDGLKIEDNPALVQQKSRDFYWYSPVLKRQLDHVTGDSLRKNTLELSEDDTQLALIYLVGQ